MISHKVCFLIFPGFDGHDVSGPARAFAAVGSPQYAVVLGSVTGGLIECDYPGIAFNSVPFTSITDPIDTLVITGGRNAPAIVKSNATLIWWVRKLAARASRVVCVCSGSFLAAEAGLLTRQRAATHWMLCDELERRYPSIEVERDRIFTCYGKMWTSAGASAALDLALALIEEDKGSAVALKAARELVVYSRRPGDHSQLSTVLKGQMADVEGPMDKLLAWMADNLNADLRPDPLADRANMSLRTFARYCVTHTGMTPSKLVETLRVQAARQSVEKSDTSFGTIAARYGFGDEQRMRRAFTRQVRATPADLRLRASRGHTSVGTGIPRPPKSRGTLPAIRTALARLESNSSRVASSPPLI
jgi:transcriptional regulator GlxA family with amidase domain